MFGRQSHGESDSIQRFARDAENAINELRRWEGDRRRSELLDGVAQLTAHQFDRASTYTTVVIAAGYAGFFTAWTVLGPASMPQVHAAAGLCAILSLAVFIAWEVFKMTHTSVVLARVVPLLNAEPLKQHEWLERIQRMMQQHNLWLTRIWPSVLVVTVALSAIAAALLIYIFIMHVLSF